VPNEGTAENNISAGGTHWFKFTSSNNYNNSSQYIHASFGTLAASLSVTVYNANGTENAAGGAGSAGTTITTTNDQYITRNLQSGLTYYIRITSTGSGTYKLLYNTSPWVKPTALNTPGGTAWTEGDLAVNGIQWFSFNATVGINYIHGAFGTLDDFTVRVYQSNRDPAAGGNANITTAADNNRYVSFTASSAGTHYIRVRPGNHVVNPPTNTGKSGTYRLTFNTTPWVNPTNIPDPDTWVNGNIVAGGQQWFSFVATSEVIYYVHGLNGTLTQFSAQLCRDDGSVLDGFVFTNPARIMSGALVQGTTYYIRVRPVNTALAGDYRIAFTETATPPAP
jgi:hypothetical protein